MYDSFMLALHAVNFTLQLTVFLTLTAAGFIVLAISFFAGAVFGSDHDVGHDHDMADHGGEFASTISIFSPKIFFVFLAAFGGGGSIATLYGMGSLSSSLFGLLAGLAFGGIAYVGLSLLYKAQANSVVKTTDAIGQVGHVLTTISERGGVGEVEVNVSGQNKTYTAQAKGDEMIRRGTSVKVVEIRGSTLLVEVVA